MVNKKSYSRAGQKNSLRIIAGTLRGSRLAFASAEGLRPTGDRARETLFNWLAAELPGARCVDLFAGSGALSIEALSRGAASATAVELNGEATALLRQEARRLNAAGISVDRADVMAWLQSRPAAARAQFDIAFIDPPFGEQLHEEVCTALEASALLVDGAAIYIESRWLDPQLALPQSWSLHRERKLGEVRCALYYRDSNNSAKQF
ncbi:MAG: 16S rRNA (guanine(966)-N(2))-methyltransferase RsmD [Gammaproteobacteria bacterium]|nr:16S rRNA (guanine(966)-N(2))-methyltransferase RsmD [Gammaproteobacteria bacterium]MBT8150176.1 16S rRNA (guanine(966)-N(2))-methyltransferase RsmD [Gammaproteobacteria bacterium]NNM11101.1 16S rRNA (guanine(966)-N(2))-methyltransferase RsmD [Pseudomonadales bacterium]RZV60245.1 MAG: 16S rRNA (guanine(966)-N(2))-methyltransferase RsmD [Pseudomonadales bacterium]